MGCVGEHTALIVAGGGTSYCTEAAFLMWVAELALAGVCLIYGVVLLLVAQSIVRISPWAVARLAIGMQTSRFRFATLAAGALTERKRAAEQRKVLALSKIVMAVFFFVMVALALALTLTLTFTRTLTLTQTLTLTLALNPNP